MEAPWVKTRIFVMDWLHCADQGSAADFIGNVFYQLVGHYPGSTKEDRYKNLFQDILQHYEANGVEDRLDHLAPTFVESRQGMKLRCSAAKCRKLVPFVAELTQSLCDMNEPVEQAMAVAAQHLKAVYDCLSSGEDMKQSSIYFAAQYVALHDSLHPTDDRLFRLKPKLHLFLHLCGDGGRPSKHWCYRDEDFGGSVAKAARRRGGLLRPKATSFRVLTSLQIGTPRICIR